MGVNKNNVGLLTKTVTVHWRAVALRNGKTAKLTIALQLKIFTAVATKSVMEQKTILHTSHQCCHWLAINFICWKPVPFVSTGKRSSWKHQLYKQMPSSLSTPWKCRLLSKQLYLFLSIPFLTSKQTEQDCFLKCWIRCKKRRFSHVLNRQETPYVGRSQCRWAQDRFDPGLSGHYSGCKEPSIEIPMYIKDSQLV